MDEVSASSCRRPILRNLLGVDCFDPELHAILRSTKFWTMASESSGGALLALFGPGPSRCDIPVLRLVPGGTAQCGRCDARMDLPNLPASARWSIGWEFHPITARIRGISNVGWSFDAARARMGSLVHDVYDLHPTSDVKLFTESVHQTRHVRLRWSRQ